MEFAKAFTPAVHIIQRIELTKIKRNDTRTDLPRVRTVGVIRMFYSAPNQPSSNYRATLGQCNASVTGEAVSYRFHAYHPAFRDFDGQTFASPEEMCSVIHTHAIVLM